MHITHYIFSLFRRNSLRYIACILGFSVALGSVFTISTFTNMMDRAMNRFFMVDNNTITVMAKGSTLMQVVPLDSRIPDNITDEIYDIYGVHMAIPMIFKDFNEFSSVNWIKDIVVGLEVDLLEKSEIMGIELKEGRMPIKNQDEVLIGAEIGEGTYKLNDKILIREKNFTIAGIIRPDNFLFDHFIYCDYKEVQELFNLKGYCSVISVIPHSLALSNNTELNRICTEIRNISPLVQTMTSESVKGSAGSFFEIIKLAQAVLGLFPLGISVTFIFLLMILNVKDLQREFGILRAIGMPNWKIGAIVMVQSLILTAVSYGFGIFTGIGLFAYSYNIVNQFQSQYSSSFIFAKNMFYLIPPEVFEQTLFATIFIGLIVAMIPTIKAVRMNIVQSIRKEE